MMKLSNRIFIITLAVVVISGLASAVVGAVLISKAVRSEAFSHLYNELKVARLFLDQKLKELSIASQVLAEGVEGEIVLKIKPDLALVIRDRDDQRGSILYSYLMRKGWISIDGSESGFITIPVALLKDMGLSFSDLTDKSICDDQMTFWLFATSYGKQGKAFSGILLNGNEGLVSDFQELLFGSELYKSKPFGTVTIFCRDKRVATTVIGPEGKVAVGTRVSDVVRHEVLDEGGVWLDRALVVDSWYLSAYEPIKSPTDENLGILYVGLLEKKFLDIRKRALFLLSGIIVPTLGLLILGVFFIARGIVRPVSQLASVSRKIAEGELDTQADVSSNSLEIKTLAHSFNQMVDAIKKREKMLRKKNIDLAAANKDYQELMSFVTHELNNSIGSLLLNVSILTDGTMGEMDPDQKEVAGQILRDVERFRDMVRNYLNISRLEKGTLRYHPGPVDVRKSVVEPVVRRFEERIKHKKIKIIYEWEEDAVINADQELLDICYSNLIVNALKYGKDWIALSLSRDVDGYVLGVRNGGTPIPEDKIKLLFRKFSRLVKSDDGAGLGLYLIRKIIERHGGTVWCESSAESGTAFYMKLPA